MSADEAEQAEMSAEEAAAEQVEEEFDLSVRADCRVAAAYCTCTAQLPQCRPCIKRGHECANQARASRVVLLTDAVSLPAPR